MIAKFNRHQTLGIWEKPKDFMVDRLGLFRLADPKDPDPSDPSDPF